MTTTTHYAAIDGTDPVSGAVYGVGADAPSARTDARLSTGLTVEDVFRMRIVPCTAAAAEYVREHGGQSDARLTVSRSGVCLSEEE